MFLIVGVGGRRDSGVEDRGEGALMVGPTRGVGLLLGLPLPEPIGINPFRFN